MFGLSLSKILLTAAIILAVFYVSKLVRRRGDALVDRANKKAKPKAEAAARKSVELAKCSACEVFVNADSDPCERADCPQRG